MTPFVIRENYIKPRQLALFDLLVQDVNILPDLDPSDKVSCHSLCRALALRHPSVHYVDGYFNRVGQDHTWLDLGDGIIADMYPIAGARPMLVEAGHWMSPWSKMYIPKPTLLDEGNRDRALQDVVAQELFTYLEELQSTAGWIDSQALVLAKHVANQLTIDDPKWIARIQVSIIDGIRNGVRKASNNANTN